MIKKIVIVILVFALGFSANEYWPTIEQQFIGKESDTDRLIEVAFKTRQNDLQVGGQGTVIKLLKDDLKGSRHQRFIIRLQNQQTLLIAHNIDLAPRIDQLKKGDNIEFYGEYEWTQKGGVIHWTHHDPKGRHVDGWIKHKGRTYQ